MEGGTLDAQVPVYNGVSPGLAWLGSDWVTVSRTVQPVSDLMLGLACLILAAVAARSLIHRRNPDAAPPGRGTVWMLGISLVGCGLLQLTRVVTVAPMDRLAATPVLAAVACWAAALSLRQPGARAVAIPSQPDPGTYQARPKPVADADTVVVVNRRRLEDDLRRSEARVREFAEADTRKNEFLAMLGHELRNPLAPIRNAVRIMKHHDGDNPDLCWARDVVDHQLRQLGQLVDDLQEMSRVTGGKVRLNTEPVDVASIVMLAVETSRPTIDAHRHRLSLVLPPGPVLVDADLNRMAQVLSNLLNNAAKYTEDGGQIRLGVAVEGADVVFRVRDNGVGIPPEMLPRVFDLFAQVGHSLDRSQGGLGLGLNLVRSLTEMHGGSVQARSEGAGQGSEFLVRLPVLTRAHTRAQPGPRSDPPAPARTRTRSYIPRRDRALDRENGTRADMPSPSPARRVLVVDDNATAAQSMALILKLERYEVQVAFDGLSAIDAVRSFRPAAVLMDIGLPGLDGLEVARRIRQDPELSAGIDLLAALTGFAEDEARYRSEQAGFDHHLVKPVDPEAVLALLASLEWARAEQTQPAEAL
jgi:signal transduction histidine kinase/ActR/RegA family two-component response regulator